MKLFSYVKIGLLSLVLVLITSTAIAQPTPPVRLKFKRVSDWNTGCIVKITIINIVDTAINGWKLAFTMIPQVDAGSPWDCVYTNNAGEHVFTNASNNALIKPKDSVAFSFQCTYTGNFKAPLPCTFNGNPNHFEHYNINNNANCGSITTYYLNSETYLYLKEIKLGQGRIYKIWAESADAYIPENRLSWAIGMVHAHQLFRNMVRTNTVPLNFYFTTPLKESFCGCDPDIKVKTSPYPLMYRSSSIIDGCFQIESTSAYSELMRMYPQRFPAGGHTKFIAGANFETAALVKAYYDIFAVKFLHISKGFKPVDFFNTAKDSLAGLKVIAVAYNRGLWSDLLVKLLDKDRTAALNAPDLLTLFPAQSVVTDYVTSITNCTNLLNDKAYKLSPDLLATNPATGVPYNTFFNYYDTLVAWSDVNGYVDKISGLYPTVDIQKVKDKLQQRFNTIKNGNPISFRYEFPAIINDLMLLLPVDDPGEYISSYYGCLDNQIPTTDEEIKNEEDELLTNYPNPAQHFTTISFKLNHPSAITLKLYDYKGALVYKTPSSDYSSGTHAVKVSTEHLNAGIYFYQLSTDKTVQTKKMLVVK